MTGGGGAFELCRVSRAYGDVRVLREASARFETGRTHVLMGPSGAGKTTVLRLLLGLEAPDAGEVVRPAGARLAATFQEDRLLDGLTATVNVRAPHGHLRGSALEEFLARERAALSAVGLPVDTRPVRELSGGQRRRVAILRCALADADALFFDEPLKGMDDETVARVMAFLLPCLSGRTTFWVTHDERELAWFPGAVRWDVGSGTLAEL